MKFRLLLYISCYIITSLLCSCDKNFEKINTPPGGISDVDPIYLLSTAITRTAYGYQEDGFYRHPASAARYITLVRNETMDKFAWGPRDWEPVYTRLSTIQQLHDQAVKHGQPQYVVLSRILRAFNFAYLTDLWGDAPYSDALRARSNDVIHAAYDQQENIYKDLLKELKESNEALMAPLPDIDPDYDVLYKGDKMQWRRFANSLRLRMLLRCAKKYSAAYTDIQAMVDDPDRYPLALLQENNAVLKYLGTAADNSWPGSDMANGYDEFDKRKPSKELVDALLKLKDPRLAVWVAPTVAQTGGTVDTNAYVGVPNAISQPAQYNGGNNFISHFSDAVNEAANDRFKAVLMSCWEVSFILAEVVQQGKVLVPGETAESLYYRGIKQSMLYYGVVNTMDDDEYFQQSPVKYNGGIAQLMQQKWLAQLFIGAEGWMDQRRTGFPLFVPGPLAAQRSIPLRYMYPQSEILNNYQQYAKARAIMGGDEQTTKMWLIK